MNNSQNQQTMNYQNFNAQTMNQMNQNIMNNEYESKYFILAEFPTNFPIYAAKYESSKY